MGIHIRHAENIAFEKCTETLSKRDARPKIVVSNVKNISVNGKELHNS